MLTITRRNGEEIVIGDSISIKVLAQSNGQVRIGIRAPNDIAVHRREIYNRMEHEAGVPTLSFAEKNYRNQTH
jgi:carbon storage regulator